MRNRLKAVFNVLKDTFMEWNADKAPRLAAALAYYALFALAPLLIIVIAIAGLWFGQDAESGQIFNQIQGVVGPDAAKAIQDMVANANRPAAGVIATIIGIVTTLLGASGLFGQLQDALNTIWEVAPKPGLGIAETIKARFISFTMVLGIGFLLLISGVLSAALTAAEASAASVLGVPQVLLSVSDMALSFLVITLLFAMIFRILPDVQISWGDVWVGAIFTSLLFVLGKFLIGLYLAHGSTSSAFGAAGSLVVLLIWIYYSAQILLLGAEFTQVYARRYGKEIKPARNAIALTAAARAQQGMSQPEQAQVSQRQESAAQLTLEQQANPPQPEAPALPVQQASDADSEAWLIAEQASPMRRLGSESAAEASPARERVAARRPLRSLVALSAALAGILVAGLSLARQQASVHQDRR
jgi:membrane protein